jgi:hypothetical protein
VRQMLFVETQKLMKEISEVYPIVTYEEYRTIVWHEGLVDIDVELAYFHFKGFQEAGITERCITICDLRNGIGFNKYQKPVVN